ncbi:hypothetical protein T492DRAFT_1025513 [Pavlovales sp. CCMP2436]|nr:hypothetical protein T492DRAFT_1025513 [Pavlovales sp. CCMP2436]
MSVGRSVYLSVCQSVRQHSLATLTACLSVSTHWLRSLSVCPSALTWLRSLSVCLSALTGYTTCLSSRCCTFLSYCRFYL